MTCPTQTNLTASDDRLATPIGRANTALIRYPRFNSLLGNIQLCQDMSKIAGEPQCMILEGMPGAGKSTLVQSYAESHSRYETASGTKVPIFYLETPSPATVKGMAAKLLEAEHRPGRFLPAYRSEASEQNEQTRLVLHGEHGVVRMRQVVGILARRIVLWKQAGQSLQRGERIGLMKFVSRVDLEIDPPVRPLVEAGVRVRAAETVLAEFG